MLNHKANHDGHLADDLEAIAALVRQSALQRQDSCFALITLLRLLEGLHSEIRDGLFQEALPDNRQALYTLLRDLETKGGWPQVQSIRLQSLLGKLNSDKPAEES